jgi:hypothetical protein
MPILIAEPISATTESPTLLDAMQDFKLEA